MSFTARRRPPKRTNDACRAASLTRPRGMCCHRTGIRYPHVSGKLSTSQFHYIATPMVAGGEVVPEQIAVRWSSLPRLSVSPSLRLSQPGHRHRCRQLRRLLTLSCVCFRHPQEKKDLIAMGKTNEYSIWMKDSKMMDTMFKK